MTREEFEQARKIKGELEMIEESLRRPKSTYVIAFYKDYSSGVGVPRTEEGEDGGRNSRIMLEQKYERRKNALRKEVARIQSAINKVKDAEMRAILEGVYIADMTQEEVAEKLNIERSLVSKRLTHYFDEIEAGAEAAEFIKVLKRERYKLSKQEFKTLKGQALAGETSAAERGLRKILQRVESNTNE